MSGEREPYSPRRRLEAPLSRQRTVTSNDCADMMRNMKREEGRGRREEADDRRHVVVFPARQNLTASPRRRQAPLTPSHPLFLTLTRL